MSQPIFMDALSGLRPYQPTPRAPARDDFYQALSSASQRKALSPRAPEPRRPDAAKPRSADPGDRPDPDAAASRPDDTQDAAKSDKPDAKPDAPKADDAKKSDDPTADKAADKAKDQAADKTKDQDPTAPTAATGPAKTDDPPANALSVPNPVLADLLPDPSALMVAMNPVVAAPNAPAAQSAQNLAGQATVTEALQAVKAPTTGTATAVATSMVPLTELAAAAGQAAPATTAPTTKPAAAASNTTVLQQAQPGDAAKVATAIAVPTGNPTPRQGDSQTGSQEQGAPKQDTKPTRPVAPVAPMKVAAAVETLAKPDRLVGLKPEATGMPLLAQAQAETSAPAASATTPDAAAEALASVAAPEPQKKPEATETVIKPWEISQPIGHMDPQAPTAQRLEGNRPVGESAPLHEALRATLVQATKESGHSEMRLQLSPENLGRMEIRVISHDGTLSASIRVDHAQARDMMQTQIAELRQTLADQGIKIDKLEVNIGQDGSRKDQGFDLSGGMQQRFGQPGQQQPQTPFSLSHASPYFNGEPDPITEEATPGMVPASAPTLNSLDTHA